MIAKGRCFRKRLERVFEMQQYSEKEKKIFLAFYQDCKQKGITPVGSEAGRQKAVLLVKENKELKKLFPDSLEEKVGEIYQMGEQYEKELKEAEQKAKREAEIAEHRKVDEAAAALELECSKKHGRDKRMFFYQKTLASIDQEIKSADEGMNAAAQMWAGLNALEQEKESSWGTLGGIASGVTGSSAVGAVVAADTMRRNEGIRARNEAISRKNLEMTTPIWEAAADRKSKARKERDKVTAKIEKEKLTLVEERPLEELMGALEIGSVQMAQTNGKSILIQVKVSAKKTFQLAGEVPAVIDGCLLAELYRDGELYGQAYLNFPFEGADKDQTLKGYCLKPMEDAAYTVIITPLALWLVEKYKSDNIHIQSWNNLVPGYSKKRSFQEVAISPIPWKTRLQERFKEEQERMERERREKEERLAAKKAQTQKISKLAGAGVAGFVALVLVVSVVSSFFENRAAYRDATALAEAGEYEQAIEAFEALEDYKDSPEQVLATKYAMGLARLEEGKFSQAEKIFTELGDYQDSAEQLKNVETARNESIYQEAFDLIEEREFVEARNLLLDLVDEGGYKDSRELANQLLNELNAYQEASEAYWEGDLEPFFTAMESNEYVTFDERDIANVEFLNSFLGTWEYASGDARVLTMRGKEQNKYYECPTIETTLEKSGNGKVPYVRVNVDDTYQYGFSPNLSEKKMSRITMYTGADFSIELVDENILRVTAERYDDEVLTCDYRRVQPVQEERAGQEGQAQQDGQAAE